MNEPTETRSVESVGRVDDGNSDGPRLDPGTLVRHFRVGALLATGGMGAVYEARDTILDRKVVLKFVRRDRVGPATGHELRDEARTIAQLVHPNIVGVHAVGDHEGQLWVALEHLSGSSLRDRLATRRLGGAEALRVLRGIAAALAHAHAQGIVHGDLKPSNVMLPFDGRPRVIDFGLASVRSTGASGAGGGGGTPQYMAPEQSRGAAPMTAATDIWALGLIARELLGGLPERPRAGEVEPSDRSFPPIPAPRLPEQLRALIERANAVRPEGRPSARALASALDQAVACSASAELDDSPFQGLAPFGGSTALHFVGRRAELDAATARLAAEGRLLISGPSGVGKTSFAAAAILLAGGEGDRIVRLRPGAHPFRALALALDDEPLRVSASTETWLRGDRWAADPGLFVRDLHEEAAQRGGRTILFVDALEELFTQGAPASLRDAFLHALVEVSGQQEGSSWVVGCVRDEFADPLAALGPALALGPLDRADAARALEAPIERAGHRFDDHALPGRIVETLADEAGVWPPLLQLVGAALWARRESGRRVLRAAALADLGGVDGVLVRHANHVLAGLGEAEARVARRALSEPARSDAPLRALLVDARLLVVDRTGVRLGHRAWRALGAGEAASPVTREPSSGHGGRSPAVEVAARWLLLGALALVALFVVSGSLLAQLFAVRNDAAELRQEALVSSVVEVEAVDAAGRSIVPSQPPPVAVWLSVSGAKPEQRFVGTTSVATRYEVVSPRGPVLLQVQRRRLGGVACASSVVEPRELPARLHLVVPSCEASEAQLLPVPEGEFRRPAPGGVLTRAFVAGYRLDREPVSWAAYARFAGQVEPLGVAAWPTPVVLPGALEPLPIDPNGPARLVDAARAEAFCRFTGKRLPTRDEWSKAAAGGLDASPAASPNTGPYGHVGLGGEVAEWTSTVEGDRRVVMGGPSGPEFIDPRAVSVWIGFRCADSD